MTIGSVGRLLTAATVAGAFSVVTYAQTTTPGTAEQRADADRDKVVTVTGCLMPEAQVPGRDETVFQRWGLTQQDYVLTNARAQQAAQPGQQPAQPGVADRPADAPQMHADHMLKIEGKEAEQLKQYANQRVEIRGEIQDRAWYDRALARGPAPDAPVGTAGPGEPGAPGAPAPDAPAADPGDRLTSIEVESIRPIGPC